MGKLEDIKKKLNITDEDIALDIRVDNEYQRIVNAEMEEELSKGENIWIRTKHKPKDGSSAYGPAQMTHKRADDKFTRKYYEEDPEVKDWVKNRYIPFTKKLLYHGDMEGKIPDYDQRYDYGGEGDFTEKDKEMYERMIKLELRKDLKDNPNLDVPLYWHSDPDDRYREAYGRPLKTEKLDKTIDVKPEGEEAQITLGKERVFGKGRDPSFSEWKPSVKFKVGNFFRNFQEGIEKSVLSKPQIVGGLMRKMGERGEEKPRVIDWVYNPGMAFAKLMKSKRMKETDYDERLAEKGKRIIEDNRQYLREIGELSNWRSPEDKYEYETLAEDLGQGATSLATAMGVALVTKRPEIVPMLFNAQQQASIYQEAREKGLSPEKAGRLSTLAGGVEAALEYIGLDFMLSSYGSPLKNILIRSGSEGLQEWAQQVGENVITKLGRIRSTGIFTGAGRAALIGTLLATPSSVSLDVAERQGMIDNLKKRGLTTKEAKEALSFIIKNQRKYVEKFTGALFEALKEMPQRKGQVLQPFGDFSAEENVKNKINKNVRNLEKELSKEMPVRKLKETIRKNTGLANLARSVILKENIALRNKLRAESKGSKTGFKAGKNVIKQQEKIKREVVDIARKINNFKKAKLPIEFKEQVDNELNRLGLLKRARPLRAKKSLKNFVLEQLDKGEMIPISESELALADYGDLSSVTLDLLKRKHKVLNQIVNIGRNQNKLLSMGENQYYDDKVLSLRKSMSRMPRRFQKRRLLRKGQTASGRQLHLLHRAMTGIDKIVAPLRKVEFVSRTVDGFKDGPVTRSIIYPAQKAAQQEFVKKEIDYAKISNILKRNKIDIDTLFKTMVEVNYNDKVQILSKEELVGLYLNTFNKGNKERLTAEEGWGLTEEQIADAINNRLTENERKFTQEIQKLIENKWDEIAKIKEIITGTKMGKVEGYWPIYTDKELDNRAKLREQEKDMFQDVIDRTFVEKGFTKERVGGTSPVELRFMKVLLNHLDKVNHFTTHALPVRDIQKLIHDKDIQTDISDIMGTAIYNEYPKWLRRVANPKNYVTNSWEKAIRKLRTNSTMATLGIKLTVSLVQAGSYSQTIHELGLRDAVRGLSEFYFTGPIKNAKIVYTLSDWMRFRNQQFDREYKEWMDDRRVKKLFKGNKDKQELLFSIIKAIDQMTTLPTWWSAYQKGMRTFKGDVAKSVEYADGVTRRTQPTGAIVDLPSVATGNEFQKLFTMFYTHFANYQNQISSSIDKFKMEDANGLKKTRNLSVAYLWLVIVPAIFSKLVKSGGKERDLKEYAKGIVSYTFAGIPFLRDIVNSALKQNYYNITSPGLQGLEEAGRFLGETFRPVFGNDFRFDKFIEHGTKSAGFMFGLPTEQGWVTLDGIHDLWEGNTKDFRRLGFSKYQLKEDKKKKKKSGYKKMFKSPVKKRKRLKHIDKVLGIK